jgi:hypothetical protein
MTNEHSSILTKAIEAANGNLIQATFFQLGASQAASRKAQHSERVSKKAEIEILKSFAENNHYWFKKIISAKVQNKKYISKTMVNTF